MRLYIEDVVDGTKQFRVVNVHNVVYDTCDSTLWWLEDDEEIYQIHVSSEHGKSILMTLLSDGFYCLRGIRVEKYISRDRLMVGR